MSRRARNGCTTTKDSAALVLAAALVAGYTLGHARLPERFINWNWERALHGAGRGQDRTSVRNTDGLLWIALHPLLTARALRTPAHTGPAPAPDLNPNLVSGSDRAK